MIMRSPVVRAALLFAAAVTFVAVLVLGALPLVIAQPPPAHVVAQPPAGAALTQHVTLVIIDGLRHEFAVDDALMPELARRMREHTSGEIWANPVSMTSSAILTYATGQRGDIEQIVNNESGKRVEYDHLMKSARAAGLATAYTGDRAWKKMFPDGWDLAHPDPTGVGIETDYNAEIFEAAYEFLRREPRANFSVYHFVTPDHQGHAYGVLSERYRTHLHAFDGTVAALLDAIPPDTTVFVTSDHGMTDTGTHGSDTPIQRRSPILAYGPGIVKGRKETRPLDQIDLPGTFAALLGISSPAESRGLLLADWLDVSDEQRATLACAELARLGAYARASGVKEDLLREAGAACAAPSPRERTLGATRVAASLDVAVGEARAGGVGIGLLVPLFALAGALGLSAAALGPRVRRQTGRLTTAALLALVAIAVAVSLTYAIELLPGRWPNPVRIALYTCVNSALVAAIVRPRQAMSLLDRHFAWAVVLFPGLLIVSQTRATQPESYALSAVLGLFALTIGLPREAAPPAEGRAGRFVASRFRIALVVVLLAGLAPVGTQEAGFLPNALTASPTALLAVACAAIVLFALERRARDARSSAGGVALGVALALGSLVLRRSAPAPLCITAWMGLGVAAVVALRGKRRALGELCALGSYAWVSRDAEIPLVLATYVVAASVGDALGDDLRRDGDMAALRPSAVLAITAFLFAWAYVQRVGVQLGIDFTQFDWGAGGFREADVSLYRIGAALAYKHSLARGAVLFAVLAPLSGRYRVWAARGILVAELARTATLVTMLYYCRESFWTALRLIGDLPHALAAVVVTALAHVVVVGVRERENEQSYGPVAELSGHGPP